MPDRPMSTNWSRRDVGRACAALVGGYLLAGCQPDQLTIETQTTQAPTLGADRPLNTGDLQAVLDRRAQALLDGDEQAFLAELDQSNQEMVQRERLRFANLRQLELSNLGFVVRQDIPASATGPEDTDRNVFAPVMQVTQLTVDEGAGGVAPAEAFQYTVRVADGKLVVADIAPMVGALAEDYRISRDVVPNAPWNTTPLRVLHAGNVWLMADDSVPDLESFAAPAEAEAGKVEALWGDRIRFPGYILFFTRNETNFRTWYDLGQTAPADLSWLEGVQIPLQGVRANGELYNGQYAGSRIVVNLASTEFNGDDPQYLMRHELAHAVTAQAGPVEWVSSQPRWAVEGFARWVENMENPSRQAQQRAVVADGVRAGRFGGTMPPTEDFYNPDVINFNYALGASVFRFIEQTKGRDTAIEFYARTVEIADFGERQRVEETSFFNTVCEEVLGVGSETFLQQWSGFVRGGA